MAAMIFALVTILIFPIVICICNRKAPFKNNIRLSICGPITGSLAALASLCAEVMMWVSYGQPEGYFRGWGGLDFLVIPVTAVGGLLGTLYGIALCYFENKTKRKIRLHVSIPLFILMVFFTELFFAEMKFRDHRNYIVLPFMFILGFIISVLFSLPAEQKENQQP